MKNSIDATRSVIISLIAGISLIGIVTDSAFSAIVDIEYTSTIDLSESPLSGDSNTAVSIQYSFDDATAPIGGSGTFAYYGGVSGTAQIGSDTLSFSNAQIYVYNNHGGNPLDYYQLLVRETAGANIVGDVGGVHFDNLEFFVQYPESWSSTALVTSLGLLESPIFNSLRLDSFDFGDSYNSTDPATLMALTPVPLPAALPLFAGGLGLLGLLGWRRKRTAA